VQRGHQALKLTYRVPELKIDYPYLILSFIGFLYLAIGLFTLFRGERRESTMFYFITLLSFVVYVYTPAGDIDFTYKLLQIVEEFATILLPPLTLNFFLLFPRPIVRSKWLVASLYIPPALLALWDLDLLVFNNRLTIATAYRSLEVIQRWEIAHFAIYFTLAVVALAYTYRTAAAVGRKQIKWIYLGMVLGFLPFLMIYIIPWFVVGSVKPIYSTISILLIAGVLIPVKSRIESVIDMFVYRESYRHRRAMTEFAQELATFHDVHELISMMRERMRAALDIEKMNLFTREGASLVIYEEEN